MIKSLPAVKEPWVQPLDWEDPPEKEMAAHSNILAWRIPMGREDWWATVHGVAESQTWLNGCQCKKCLTLFEREAKERLTGQSGGRVLQADLELTYRKEERNEGKCSKALQNRINRYPSMEAWNIMVYKGNMGKDWMVFLSNWIFFKHWILTRK